MSSTIARISCPFLIIYILAAGFIQNSAPSSPTNPLTMNTNLLMGPLGNHAPRQIHYGPTWKSGSRLGVRNHLLYYFTQKGLGHIESSAQTREKTIYSLRKEKSHVDSQEESLRDRTSNKRVRAKYPTAKLSLHALKTIHSMTLPVIGLIMQ